MKINVRTLVFSMSLIMAIFFLAFIFESINSNEQQAVKRIIAILFDSPFSISFLMGSLVGLAYITFNYLDKEPNKRNIQPNYKVLRESIVKEVYEKLLSRKTINSEISEEEKHLLVEQLKNKIEHQTAENLLHQLKTEISSELVNENFEIKINKTISRLEDERMSLARRGNLNLVLGMILSIFGLAVLASSIFANAKEYTDLTILLLNMLPKTVLALFIEIFAYFFLRLYKQSLDDIKFYQNELTNIEAKYLSLGIAKQSNNHKLISTIIEELVKTERNFILESGQSTIEIEKEKISSSNSNNVLNTIKDIINTKK